MGPITRELTMAWVSGNAAGPPGLTALTRAQAYWLTRSCALTPMRETKGLWGDKEGVMREGRMSCGEEVEGGI